MASTTTWKYGPKISLSHVTMKGGGGPDPFIVKDYEKGPFFAALPNKAYVMVFSVTWRSRSDVSYWLTHMLSHD